jgi:hypothetical protein
MKRGFAARRAGYVGLLFVPLWFAACIAAQRADFCAAGGARVAQRCRLHFFGQANLGAPFQVDSGGLAETKRIERRDP